MICKGCGANSNKIISSRKTGDSSIRRRRECEQCGYRWTTSELPVEEWLDLAELMEMTAKEMKKGWRA